ncbi:MAG TPA: hypothetical protein VLT59_02070, partial [Steroidobacteraceae bacterium]|nr:hypothetical protein [Steroidobacteraceae bacterium]
MGEEKPPFRVFDSDSMRISDAVSGEVCSAADGPSEVCKPGETIHVVGQDICDWSEDVQYPCTRYGYEFDFEGGTPKEHITCKVARSIRTIFGPGTEKVTGENTAEYTVDVTAESGRIFHRGFQTYAPVEDTVVVHENHACSYLGEAIYQVVFIHRFEPE